MTDAMVAQHVCSPQWYTPDALYCTLDDGKLVWKLGWETLSVHYIDVNGAISAALVKQRRFRIQQDINVIVQRSSAESSVADGLDDAIDAVRANYSCATVYITDEGTALDSILRDGLQDSVINLTPFQLHDIRSEPRAAAVSYAPAGASAKQSSVPLHIDVLAFLPSDIDPEQATDLLDSSLQRQLTYVVSVLKKFQEQRRTLPSGVTCCHYTLDGFACPLTIAHPLHAASASPAEEADLANFRTPLHKAFGQPLDRPCLRLSNATPDGTGPQPSTSGSDHLQDVHVTLPPTGMKGSRQYMVSGSYIYHHYMQDNFNDKGWGCAYRSLQTIWSWFRLQGYTDEPVPSHRDMQMVLAKLGDKPASFVGSKQWVGAVELGMVLQQLLGIDFRILTASKGTEVPSLARDVAQHFMSQGTPIMVGGGVLAYTLLGIDWNEDTGDVMFLILDPHYTGAEQLDKIKAGTWVGWKKLGDAAAAGGPLFAPNSFYNLLCPQRPRTV